MRFFLQNMLENCDSNLQTKFGLHITSNIFKIIQFKNHGIAPTPIPPPNFESLPSTNNLIIWSYSTKVCVRLLKR